MNPPKRIPFTAEGYQAMQDEFDKLTKLRPEILVRLQLAREMGDLSENGAYKAARSELGDTDRRLRYLTRLLRLGRVTESHQSDTIQFGNRITLATNGKEMSFTLVNGYESDPKQQKLSDRSPIGQAILGKKVGDTVIVQTPNGSQTYTITEVR